MKQRVIQGLLSALIGILIVPTVVYAVVQSLNGATGMTQTFQSDSNVTISTDTITNVHSLGWSGQLPVSRGGTGANSFNAGSVLFSNGSTIAEDNANLFWNETSKYLSLGGNFDAGFNAPAINILVPSFESSGGFTAGESFDNGVSIWWLSGNNPTQGEGHIDTFFYDNPIFIDGSKLLLQTLTPGGGDVGIGTANPNAKLDVAGTIRGNSTIFLGNPSTSACIEMADSDGSGVTYVTVNDGVLSASTTKPSFCQ